MSFFQSYCPKDFGPEVRAVIPDLIRRLLAETGDPDQVVERLRREGYEVEIDSYGYANVSKGKERCQYPLKPSVVAV